jgi:hypothetical protein
MRREAFPGNEIDSSDPVGIAVSLLGTLDEVAGVNARGVESTEPDREECFGDAAKDAVVSLGIILEPAVDGNHSKANEMSREFGGVS